MRKIIAIYMIFITASVTLICSGCSKNNRENNKDIQVSAEANIQTCDNNSVDSKKDVQWQADNDENTKGLRLVNGAYIGGITKGDSYCYNEQGLYYLSELSSIAGTYNYAYKIMYIDYATRQEVYLCSNSGCNHDTDECTSVVKQSEIGYDSSLFWYDGYLYLLGKDSDQDGSLTSEGNAGGDYEIQSHPAVLYQINPDGTGRTKVYEFDENVTVEDAVFAGDNSLYFVTKKLQANKKENKTYHTSTEKKIVEIDISTWKAEEVYRFENDTNTSGWQVIGGFDNSIVAQRTVYNHERTIDVVVKEFENASVDCENWKNSVEEVVVINLEDKSLKNIYSDSNDTGTDYVAFHGFAQKDGILYATHCDDDKIYRIDIKTGKKDVLAEFSNSEIQAIWGDELYCLGMGFVNTNDGTIKKNNMKCKSLPEFSVEIKAETKDYFLVLYDYGGKEDEQYEGSYDISAVKYALITKEDMYDEKENYLPIAMLGEGTSIH